MVKKTQVCCVQGGKWEARLGHSKIKKQSYLGLFDTEEAAAKAYDTATVNEFGHNVPTNFDLANVSLLGRICQPCVQCHCCICHPKLPCCLQCTIKTGCPKWSK